MNCQQMNEQLDDFMDRQLSESEMAACMKHLQACNSCQMKLEQAQRLAGAMRSLPVQNPVSGFSARVLARVRIAHFHAGRVSFFSGFATASLLAVAILAVGLLLPEHTVNQREQTGMESGGVLQTVSMTLHEPHNVRLVFSIPRDMDQVTLRVALPQNVVLARGTATREIEWQTSLTKGKNVLTLPLKANAHGEGELSAVLTHEGVEKAFRLRLITRLGDVATPPQTNTLGI